MTTYLYNTVSEAINDLTKRGYTTDFQLLADEECLLCNKTAARLSPNEFEIDETYRFEGNSDPGDEMIVFAVSSVKQKIKGIVVNAYGMYSDTATAKIVERLHQHIITKPIKRNALLTPLSHEHHHALLLCWKIRAGIKKNVDVIRIKKYIDWFYLNHLRPHLEVEELYLFPILGNENNHIKKVLADHQSLKRLFEEITATSENISQIEKELESHIRFEERVLFKEIQSVATLKQLEAINISHAEEKFCDNLSDTFWE